MDAFWAAPPISRTLAATTAGTSVLVYSGLLSAQYIIFEPSLIFKLFPELWRLATSFLITGPGLSILFDTYFLYTYGSALEANTPRFDHPADFLTYILFVCSFLLVTCGVFLGNRLFGPAFLLAIAYTYAQENVNRKVTFIILQVPAQLLPYLMLLATLVSQGPGAAMSQSAGLLAAHLFDFLTRLYPTFVGGRPLITTPSFLKKFFNVSGPVVRGHGTAFRNRPANNQAASGTSTGISANIGRGISNIWSNRGQGRRLGGD